MKNLNEMGVQEMNSRELKETEGGGERWARKIGNFIGHWLSAYAQKESLGAFKL